MGKGTALGPLQSVTLTLDQVQGASGYHYMKEDLDERARLRGQGKVRDLVLQSFIVE